MACNEPEPGQSQNSNIVGQRFRVSRPQSTGHLLSCDPCSGFPSYLIRRLASSPREGVEGNTLGCITGGLLADYC